jgi:hypothetical protein
MVFGHKVPQFKTLEGDCHEVEIATNWELLVAFGMSLEGV